jgi:hypothetical protein
MLFIKEMWINVQQNQIWNGGGRYHGTQRVTISTSVVNFPNAENNSTSYYNAFINRNRFSYVNHKSCAIFAVQFCVSVANVLKKI